jgi:hypothetical protein
MITTIYPPQNNLQDDKKNTDNYIVVKKECVLINTFISNDDPYKNLYNYMVEEVFFD